MNPRLGLAMYLSALALAWMGMACGTAAPKAEAPVAVTGDDPDAIRSLFGYRSEMVNAPHFSGQVYVMEAGPADAPAVVLVHGLGESGSRDWHPILPALAARYRVITFDLPGFGRSTHAHDLYSPDGYVQFIHDLVGPRMHGAFNLVGHSMGGAIALRYAGSFPGDVKRLMLIDAAGILHRKAYVNFAVSAGLDNLLGLLAGTGKDLANLAMDATSQSVSPILPVSPDPSFVLQSNLLRATILDSSMRIAALATILEDFGPTLAKVEAPTWILWGRHDAVASPRSGLLLKARLPYAQLKVLERSGHDPMTSEPAAVADYLLQALATPEKPPFVRVPPAPFTPPERMGSCDGQSGVNFAGDYSDIDIKGCWDVRLKDVRARSLRIRDSHVVVENTRVVSQAVAFAARGSRVEVTASDFVGDVAIDMDNSDIDLAGADLQGQRASVHVASASRLIFSVSHLDSPVQRRYVHDLLEPNSGEEL
jgi:pimeloyl-ACP methyl ester carboxylesterase